MRDAEMIYEGPHGAEAGSSMGHHPAAIARLVADEGPVANVLLDPAGRILWSSGSFHRLVKTKASDLKGRRLVDLLRLSPGGPDEGSTLEGGWRRTWLTLGQEDVPRLILMSEIHPAGREVGGARLLSFIDTRVGSADSCPALADPQTGLASSWVFEDRLKHAMERADRSEQGLAVLLIRLDHPDRTLERGEAVMQMLLKQVSRRLSSTLRAEDSIAYLGRYRWGVMLEHPVSPERLQVAALRCLEAMEAPLSPGVPPLLVTLSIGIAIYPDDNDTVTSLLAAAERALGHAEPGGCAFFDRNLRRQLASRMVLRESLQQALLSPDRNFSVVYQPQCEPGTGRGIGVDCLVRWHHPQYGSLNFADFLLQVAELGEMVRLGRWVIKQVARQRQQWLAQCSPLGELDITVKIDASLLASAAFDGRSLDRFLGELQQRLDWLILEIDGQSLEVLGDEHSLLLRRIARQGARLSVDNLGDGAVNLLHLSRLPVATAKISRQLVGKAGQAQCKTLEALVASLQRLGIEVAAAGVETPKQLEAARQAGIGRVQGSLIGEAMAAEELQGWLSGRGIETPR